MRKQKLESILILSDFGSLTRDFLNLDLLRSILRARTEKIKKFLNRFFENFAIFSTSEDLSKNHKNKFKNLLFNQSVFTELES